MIQLFIYVIQQPGEGRTRPRFPGYRCEQCEMHFQDIDLFELHRLSMHSLPRFTSYACQACNQIFSSRNLLGKFFNLSIIFLPKSSKAVGLGSLSLQNGNVKKLLTLRATLLAMSPLLSFLFFIPEGHTCPGRPVQPLPKTVPLPTPSKPFVCGFCNQPFGRKSVLKNHISTVHLGERRFVCEYPDCRMPFGLKSKLHRRFP